MDRRSAGYLIACALNPPPVHGVAMRELVPRRAAVVATVFGVHYVMVEKP